MANSNSKTFDNKLLEKLWKRRRQTTYSLEIIKKKGKTLSERKIAVPVHSWHNMRCPRAVQFDCNQVLIKEHDADSKVVKDVNYYKLSYNYSRNGPKSTVYKWDLENSDIDWNRKDIIRFYLEQIKDADEQDNKTQTKALNAKEKKRLEDKKRQESFDGAMVDLRKKWNDEILFKFVMSRDGISSYLKTKYAYGGWNELKCKRYALEELKKQKNQEAKVKEASEQEVDKMVKMSMEWRNQNMMANMHPMGRMASGGMYPMGGMASGGMASGGMYPMGGMTSGGMYPMGGMTSGGMYPMGGMASGGMYPINGMMPRMGQMHGMMPTMNMMPRTNQLMGAYQMNSAANNIHEQQKQYFKQLEQQKAQLEKKYSSISSAIPPVIPTPAKQTIETTENSNNASYGGNHGSSSSVVDERFDPTSSLPNIHQY